MSKKDLIDIINSHYKNNNLKIDNCEIFGDGVILTSNNKQVIYRIINNQLIIYKSQKIATSSDVSKWKSIIREMKIDKLFNK